MAEPAVENGCSNCARLLQGLEEMRQRVSVLETRLPQTLHELATTKAELERTKAELAEAQAELANARKNSRNSSKPPSSDITNPKPNNKKAKKGGKRGAQPGHPKHERPPFDESEIDIFYDYTIPCCPDCGGAVEPTDEPPRVLQQVDLVTTPVGVSEHRGQACWCAKCEKIHYAAIHEDVRRAGLVGPRLTALVAYLKGACHCSFSTIRKYLRDVMGVTISRGQLRRLCAKVAESLSSAYEQLLGQLPQQDLLNVDETGHKNNGQAMWTWCFRAATFTLFKIDPSRGSQVLLDVLGTEFNGVLGSDYFSAYRKYMRLNENVLVQFCLAHLIRDVKFLVTHPDPRNRAYGKRVLAALRELFELFHRRETLSAARFANQAEDAANHLCGTARFNVPDTPQAQNLAERFWKHGDEYLRFLTTPGIEPTNNLAEQAIRFVVIDRHVTQGSRSEAGQRWLERIWTVIATCTQQGRSVFEFLQDSVLAHFQGQTPPLLLPNTS